MNKAPGKIYNSLTRKTENLPKRTGGPLRLFVCGLTVYDTPHIGNARTYLAFDAFVKYLRAQGIAVEYLQNITDIDDKILRRAKEEGLSWKVIARRYTANYKKILKALNIDSVDTYAPATSYIKEIEEQVKGLEDKGFVYKIDGDGYYFNIKRFKEYGKLAGRTAFQAEDATTRIDDSIKKKNKGDFCVWKFSLKSEAGWKSSLGFGRPGWHIEDTAIAFKFLGSQYEIHGGGIDLKFPHHEAEIAQAEALSGKKPYVKLWMHTGHLQVEGQKMSKSLKNFITADDFLKKYEGNVLRLMVLSHHYRSPLNYTFEGAQGYGKSWKTIEDLFSKLDFINKTKPVKPANDLEYTDSLTETRKKFHEALGNDFNTPAALGEFHKLLGWVQPKLWQMSSKEALRWKKELTFWFDSLGFKINTIKIPAKIKTLVTKRDKAREMHDYKLSDELRDKISDLGYRVDDTPRGQYTGRKLD